MLTELNEWFVNHPNILVLTVPVLSGLVGWITAIYTMKRAYRSTTVRIEAERITTISQFRQSWINSLRDCMAEFQSYGTTPDQNPHLDREFYRIGTKIELLMNPSDPDYEALQEALYGYLIASQEGTIQKFSRNPGYITICQRILKREWERLKRELNDPTDYITTGR